MKKISVLVLVLFISVFAFAQKVYFVYLQNEGHDPFFVRMNNKIYSSSSSGYLILSKLRDSSYNINIGFPGGQWPEQKFSFTVNRKDQGFLLKNFNDREWGLFDMQTMAVQMAAGNSERDAVITEKKEVNAFTEMLSKAADDSTLKEKQVFVKTEEKKVEEIKQPEEKKEEPKQESKKEDTAIEKKEEIKPAEKKEEPVVEIKDPSILNPATKEIDSLVLVTENKTDKPAEEVYEKSTVKRRSESSTTEGFGLIFVDIYPGGETDTIRILIPNNNNRIETIEEIKQEDKEVKPVDTVQNLESIRKSVESNPVLFKKNTCKAIAVEDDFFKLRKKMAGVSSDDNMISEARKVFRVKCFTTQQVRNLSLLFLEDEGKYKFFDTAYNYVSDTENFASLQSELQGEYFINRFKAMLR